MKSLTNKKVAILIADGFEQSEYERPKKALDDAGAKTVTVSLKSGTVRGWAEKNWGQEVQVDLTIDIARADDFDALLLPGGVMNPDTLRGSEEAIQFIGGFVEAGKPIAAICHGPWTLINARGVAGRKLTSYHTIRVDLENAGAEWVDESVVVDNGLVTSRKPDDIPDFNRKMIEEFAEGIHAVARRYSSETQVLG
jgi:protease I